MITLNTLEADGQIAETFYWSDLGEGACWVDGSTGEAATDVTFQPGTGFWIQCDLDEGEMSITSAGQVGTSDVTTELNGETMITLVGNNTPVAVDLQDVICSANGVDMITLNSIEPDGQIAETYYWTDLGEGACWVDGSTGDVATGVMLQPGTAFWVQCDLEGEIGTITFPGVEL